MKDKSTIVLYCLGGIVVIWLAILIAPFFEGGLIEIIKRFPEAIENPFRLTFCANSIKVSLLFILIYILAIGIYISTKGNYRKGKEYGSAIWGIARQVNKKYMQNPPNENKLLTQNIKIGLKAQKHRRNLNTLVCGGSRCRKNKIFCKTQYYAM